HASSAFLVVSQQSPPSATPSPYTPLFRSEALVAESRHPLVLTETGLPPRWYLSPDDVRVPLEPSATRTRCPYKGEASYFSVRLAAGRELTHAARSYPDPLPESARIAGRLSFLHDELTTLVDGEPG